MDISKAWHILQMEPTEDEAEIKKQYKKLLPQHNPEDDPEGFKNLREAYEMALHPPKEEQEAPEEDDEIGHWLKAVDAVYVNMERRRDVKEWESLLEDPLCQGLDTAFETRERLLVYFMSHQYLPRPVWETLNKTFRFVEEKEDLLETFPENYIDYVVYQSQNDTFGNYELFRPNGEGEPEYDNYINAFYEINRKVSDLENDMENLRVDGGPAEQRSGPVQFLSGPQILEDNAELKERSEELHRLFDELKAYHVFHPYEMVEILRLCILEEKDALPDGRSLEAAAEELLEQTEDPYVLRVVGEALAVCGRWEDAKELWDRVLEKMPEHAMVQYDLARYCLQKGDYEKAENIIRENISTLNGSAKVKNFFMQVQQAREKAFEAKLQEDPDNLDAWIEMCWSRFHSDRISETLEMLDQRTYTPGTSEYYDYVDMKGRCLLEQEQYEEALEYLKKWEKALEELPDDGSEKYAKRKKTLGYQRFVLAECYANLAVHRPDDTFFEEAENYVTGAIEVEEDKSMLLPYRDLLRRIRLRSGKYKEVVDDCDEVLKEDKGDLPAYLRRQEAYYKLHNGQGVVNDYHSIIAIYKDYYRPYLLAMRVFMIHNQYGDAAEVLKAAEENGIDHPTIKLEALRLLRYKGIHENLEEFDARFESLMNEVREMDPPGPEIEEEDRVTQDHLWFEQVNAYIELEKYKEALDVISKRIRLGTELKGFYVLRANVNRLMGEYDKAIKFYKELISQKGEDVAFWFYMGVCYRSKGENEGKGIECFEKAHELDPEDDRVVYELARAYQRRYQAYEILSDYEKAKEYFAMLVEMNPSPFVLAARADLIRLGGDLDAVIEDLNEALEKSDEDESDKADDAFRLYRTGDMHYLMRHTDEAEKIFRRTLETYGDVQSAPIYQLADTLGSRGRWEEALAVLEKYLEDYKDNGNYLNKMADFYICCGKGEKSKEIYDKLREMKWLDEWEYYNVLLELVMTLEPGNFKTKYKELDEKIRTVMGIKWEYLLFPVSLWYEKVKTKSERELICRYFTIMGDKFLYARMLDKAENYLKRARALKERLGQRMTDLYRSLMICAALRSAEGPRAAKTYDKLAKMYASKAMEAHCRKNIPKGLSKLQPGEDMNSEAYYLKSLPADRAMRYERLALIHFVLGETEICEDYLSRIEKCSLCLSCRYQECYDALLVKAYMAEFKGNKQKAREYFVRAAAIAPTDIENTMGVLANS